MVKGWVVGHGGLRGVISLETEGRVSGRQGDAAKTERATPTSGYDRRARH